MSGFKISIAYEQFTTKETLAVWVLLPLAVKVKSYLYSGGVPPNNLAWLVKNYIFSQPTGSSHVRFSPGSLSVVS